MTNSTLQDGDKVRFISYINPDVVMGLDRPLPPVGHMRVAGIPVVIAVDPIPLHVCHRSAGGNTDLTAWIVRHVNGGFSLNHAMDPNFKVGVNGDGVLQLIYVNPDAPLLAMAPPNLTFAADGASKGAPWIYLRDIASGRRMDIDHGNTAPGTNVLIFKPNSGDNQIWRAELA
jgi:hypothetical protein